MTEDDTFLKLKQIHIDDLKRKIDLLSQEEFDKMAADSEIKKQFLNNNGWTVLEFDTLMKETYG